MEMNRNRNRNGRDDEKERKYHVLAVPYLSQGHINPMLQFCKRLATYGLNTTLATSLFIAKRFQPNLSPSESESVKFAAISDGFDEGGFGGAKSVADYLERFQSAGSRTLAALIEEHAESENPIDCVIYDAFMPWALEVSKRFGLPAAAFFTQACTVNYIYYLLHHKSLDDKLSFPIDVDGLRLLRGLQDMPSFVGVAGSYPAYFQMLLSQFSNAHQADFILVNTVYEFEKQAVDSMSKKIPILTIGPTIPWTYLDKRIKDGKEYGLNLFVADESSVSIIKWLETKAARSVVYVSFGSMANLSSKQMEELAMGLCSAGFHFIWVVRSEEDKKASSWIQQ